MPRTFRIRKELIPHLIPLLKQNGLAPILRDDEISVELSGNQFHRYLKQAVCEQRRTESLHPEIPVFPKEVILNDRALVKLTSEYPCFCILEEEVQGILDKLEKRKSQFFLPPEQLDKEHPKHIPCCRLICCNGAPIGSYTSEKGPIICKNLLVVYTREGTWYYPVR